MKFIGIIWLSFLYLSSSAQRIELYIEQNKKQTLFLADSFGIPAAVILGAAIMESGAGASKTSKLLNNHFGITGKNNLAKSKIHVKTRYKQFDTVYDSYEAFCEIISRKKFYTTLKGEADYEKWIDAISKAGYSTTPAIWKKEMLKTIDKYDLDQIKKPQDEKEDKEKEQHTACPQPGNP